MCGIVGITSNKQVISPIINSLRKLEYRGYDSAGIATLNQGFINEVNCPHYYGEKDRQPSVHAFINDNKIDSCFASEDGSALHYKGEKLIGSIAFYKGAKSYFIHKKSNKIIEEVIEGIDLNN